MKSKMSFRFIALGIMLIIIISAAAACKSTTVTQTSTSTTTTEVKPITLIFSTHEPGQGHYKDGFFAPWIAEIEKRTGGRIKIEAHYNGELAGPPDAWDALINGTVDISNVHLSNVPGKFPLSEVITFSSYNLVNYRPSYVTWQLYKQYQEMQQEFKECHIMFLGSTYWASYATTKKPIYTLEDLKGLKSVGMGTWQIKREEALGMVPASMGPMDILPALQTGVVDGGALGTLLILDDFGWGDFLKYITHVRMNCMGLLIGMNLDTWNSLPADIQGILDGMMDWTIDLHDSFYVNSEEELIPLLEEKYGTTFIYPSQEELGRWDVLDKPIWDQWAAELDAKGLPGNKIMDDYKALELKYSDKALYGPK